MEEKRKPIVIAGRTHGEYWKSVLIEAVKGYQDVTLHFTNKHAGHAEQFIKFLRHFGWIERDRGRTESMNTLCSHKDRDGRCGNPAVKDVAKCTENIRSKCKEWKQLYTIPLQVTWVLIEQAPPIRDLAD